MWICGSPGRDLDRRKNLAKENKRRSLGIFMGHLVCLLVAKLWFYREPRHRTLVANERKEGAKENKKASSSKGNSKIKGHPKILFVVKGIRLKTMPSGSRSSC